jgi:uncharacterized integral membrane protein
MTGLPERVSSPQDEDTPNLWAGPLFFLLLLLVPTLILVFSNTMKVPLSFAGWHGTFYLWVILLITFLAGIILSRLFGWVWRIFRRRRERIKAGLMGRGAAAS